MNKNKNFTYGIVSLFVLLLVLFVIVPQSVGAADSKWKAKYWNNRNLSGSSVLTRDEGSIDHDWGDGSPDSRINDDEFSARWTRTIHIATTGTYHFTATMDDGMRVWVDGTRIIDSWSDSQVHSVSSDTWLNAGDHEVKVEYYEAGGKAVAKLDWAYRSGPPSEAIMRWRGEYYPNQNLTGPVSLIRDDNEIDFNWGLNAPGPNVPNDHFSVRWSRNVSLTPGQIRFTVTVDDGVRLWVNGRLIIDQWHNNQEITYVAVSEVPGGAVPVVMEYFENTGAAVAKLRYEWIGPIADGANPTPVLPTNGVTAPDGPYGVVRAGALNVRATPEIGDNVVTAVARGTVLELIGRNGGWRKVRLPAGTVGWVGSSYVITNYPTSSLPILDA